MRPIVWSRWISATPAPCGSCSMSRTTRSCTWRRKPIPVFGDGSTRRDYSYVDDIVAGIRAAMDYDRTPYEVVNLGNDRTVTLMEMVGEIENALGVTAKIDRQPEQPGDVPQTWASL